MSLKLTLPPIADSADPSVETRGVYVEEWVEALPFANPVALVEEVHEALHRLNRTPLKPAHRLQLLELYLAPYQFLLELQEKQGAIHTIAALERNWAGTDAVRRLTVEMAHGYKAVLAHSLQNRSLFGKPKHLAQALQRATTFLSFALLHAYNEYLPTPRGLWTELGELYRFAEDNALADHATGGARQREEFRLSPADSYKRILVTSLVDPHHLSYGEVWNVFALVGAHAGHASLEPMREVSSPAGIFVVDPDSDRRPEALDPAEAEQVPKRAMLLSVVPIIKALQERLTGLRKSAGNSSDFRRAQRDEMVLLEVMVRTLTLPPKRKARRILSEGRVTLAAGFSAVHHFLGGAAGPASADATAADDAEGNDIEIGVPDADQESAAAPATQHRYTAEYWDLLNRSPGGVGVIKHIRPNSAIGVGEVIGVQLASETDARSWAIGVVRWLSIANLGEYQAGVQVLGARGEPVRVFTDGDGAGRPAIVIPGAGTDGATLLAPPGVYAKDAMLRLEGRRGSRRITSGALVESTAFYDRFRVQPAG